MIEDEDRLPIVTREEFDKIECNRCGACCEAFWQPGPLEMAMMIGKLQIDKRIFDYYSDEDLMMMAGWSFDQYFNDLAHIKWWSDIEPVDGVYNEYGTLKYRCHRFQRLPDGLGFCTQHETRPNVCRNFPYGKTVHDYKDCSWNVIIEDETDDPLQMVDRGR